MCQESLPNSTKKSPCESSCGSARHPPCHWDICRVPRCDGAVALMFPSLVCCEIHLHLDCLKGKMWAEIQISSEPGVLCGYFFRWLKGASLQGRSPKKLHNSSHTARLLNADSLPHILSFNAVQITFKFHVYETKQWYRSKRGFYWKESKYIMFNHESHHFCRPR